MHIRLRGSNTGPNAGSTLSTKPNEHDLEQLRIIYAHLDAGPNSWGQLVSQSANGRSSTYERDHGGGNKTVTHVFWTIEAAENCPSCDHRFPH